jgi:hypothetical protein
LTDPPGRCGQGVHVDRLKRLSCLQFRIWLKIIANR